MALIKNYLWVFFISMVPIIELRGAIPIGAGLGLEWHANLILCIIGNMLPVPFILLFIRHILEWMKKVPKLDRIALWVERKAHKNKAKVLKFASFGLFLFVACRFPEPGRGRARSSRQCSICG